VDVTDRLRTDGKVDMAAYSERLTAKHLAEVALAAADEAENTLRDEHVLATSKWQAAKAAANRARQVADIERDRIRIEREKVKLRLDAFDQVIARDDGPWTPVMARLLEGPQAPIGVEVPDRPEDLLPEQRPVLGTPATINVMTPEGMREVTPEEFLRLRREEMIRNAAGMEPYAIREQRARELARRGVG
jgi:hypothetical protein